MPGTNSTIIQPRDREFLKELSIMRVVDREQVKAVAGFRSTARVNRRLLKLVRAGLLRRFFLGSGGGRKALYAISEKGARLAGVPVRGPQRVRDTVLVADFFVDHQLAINSIYVTLKFRAIPVPGLIFHRWVTFLEPVAPELRLIPDGYVEFATSEGIAAAFLEIDLGTESLAVWREKVRQYFHLAVSGAFSRVFGPDRFRVLVIANSARRAESLRKAVAQITEKVFRFATLEDAQKRFFEPVWQRPKGQNPEPLFEEHP